MNFYYQKMNLKYCNEFQILEIIFLILGIHFLILENTSDFHIFEIHFQLNKFLCD